MADTDTPSTDRREPARPGGRHALGRGLAAGAVGVALGAVVALMQADTARCEARVPAGTGNGWECAAWPLLGMVAGPVAAPLLSWLLLLAVRVRPSWAVALLAPLCAVPVHLWAARLIGGAHGAPPWFAVVTAGCTYAAAGLTVAPGLRPRIRWAAGSLLLAVAGLALLSGPAIGGGAF